MTITQIKYFLEVAQCGSFSEAAKRLFMTQPTLNRQITSIESELNMQLFLRNFQGVRLTPAGEVLRETFLAMLDEYENGIRNAEIICHGQVGKLRIGIVCGLDITEEIRKILDYFRRKHTNIQFEIQQYGYKDLLEELYRCNLDVIITLDFHVENHPRIERMKLIPYHPAWAVPLVNPLSQKESITLDDIKEEELVVINPEECPDGVRIIQERFQNCGMSCPRFHYVDNMDSMQMWVQTGDKCAPIYRESFMAESKQVKLYDDVNDFSTEIQIGWLGDNTNLALNFLKTYLYRREKEGCA